MTSLYDNDVQVGALTREAFERSGSRLLQIHRFSENENQHTEKLLNIFNPGPGAKIADVGCGVGRLAELMQEQRPDLDFILINKSLAQLAMCPTCFERRVGTAEELPLARGSVDAIMATYVLGHVDVARFLDECTRVLNPGRHIYVYDIFKDDPTRACRLEKDLGYAQRTEDEMVRAFAGEGFELVPGSRYARTVPGLIETLMPQTETLWNTVSVAMAFEKQ